MRSDKNRLQDALEAIERIERYAQRGRAAFDSDELLQAWVIQHLEIIGEACRGLSASTREAHPEVDWRRIVAMRNILTHGYFQIDRDVVWFAVQNDLPSLKAGIRAILLGMGGTS